MPMPASTSAIMLNVARSSEPIRLPPSASSRIWSTLRTREIGIRAALGASEAALLRLVLDHGLMLTIIGLVIGLAGAIGLTRLMATMLFGIGPRDPITMVATALMLAAVATIASYVPARRATKVDPLVALRYE